MKLLGAFPSFFLTSIRKDFVRQIMDVYIPSTIVVLRNLFAKFPVSYFFLTYCKFNMIGNQFLWIFFLLNFKFNVILIL